MSRFVTADEIESVTAHEVINTIGAMALFVAVAHSIIAGKAVSLSLCLVSEHGFANTVMSMFSVFWTASVRCACPVPLSEKTITDSSSDFFEDSPGTLQEKS